MTEKILLHDVIGIARKSGVDENGNGWLQFDVDYFAGEETGVCEICGEELESGWMCLDGGEEVCGEHIFLKEK